MNKYFLLSLPILISACSVGPDYQRPEFFEDSKIKDSLKINGASDVKMEKNWYKQFNDETLNSLVEKAVSGSPNVEVAISKMRQARSSLKIDEVQDFPMLNADGSYNYSKSSKNRGFTIDTDYYQTGLDASWEIDIWGANRRLTESSEALLKASIANLDNVRLSLTAEVANNYISFRVAQEQLKIAERNLEIQKNLYRITRDKYKNGLSDDMALNQARYLVQTTKSQIPSLQYQVEAYKNALTTLVGELPSSLDKTLESKQNLAAKRFEYDLQELYNLPIDVIRNRPDVQIAEQNLISKNALVGKAVANLYPNISFSGFWGFQAAGMSNLIGSDSNMYNYSPAISLPIFHWNELTNTVELQKEISKEYLQIYKNSVVQSAGEIKNSIEGVSREYESNDAAQKAVDAQIKVADIAQNKYSQGLIEFSEVLTAQQNLLNAQNSLVSSNGKIYGNIIAFYKSIGAQ